MSEGPDTLPTSADRPVDGPGASRISLHDHSETHPCPDEDMERLRQVLGQAWPLILPAAGSEPSVLNELEEIEISLLDDAPLAAIHGDFLGDPTPTDVITFHHGEILVSVETAVREAASRGESPLRETALYIIHGLLHLHGHTDSDPACRAHMHATQDAILEQVWPRN